jgi:xylan 1,4-beta-xylosidase
MRHFVERSSSLVLLLTLTFLPSLGRAQAPANVVIDIDASAPTHAFPHFWEQMFGSGRAILTLRESYRRDLREVRQITDFRYVRFHDILDDDIGVYDEDQEGHAVYNFSYVDQVYDGLLANGVKPFVELSFMPKKLAARADALHAFWYKQNVSPPRDYERWGDLVEAFTRHLVQRYGIDEVATWYFEVWNEPNIDFWVGDPKQATYYQLYDHAARAIKKVDARLRIGGPATAQAAWTDAFLKHAAANNVPVDFVSTHVYGNDRAQDVFGTDETIPRNQMVCRAVRKVHDQIKASSMPNLPLIWSEFNASYANEPPVTDAAYMGPWLADTIRQCDGLVDILSYWAFSDVFDEQGVVKTPFYGGYGLIAVDDIPKPAFAAFELLHKLGDQRIALDSDSALVTRRKDGTLILAVWNYAPPGEAGTSRVATLRFKNARATHATIWRVDPSHADVHSTYQNMGEPRYPTRSQIEQLRKAAAVGPPEERTIKDGNVTVDLPAHGLAVVKIK